MACNTIHTGKGMKIPPKALIDDGLIDLVIVKKAKRLRLLKVFPSIFNGSHINEPEVIYAKVRSFSLRTTTPGKLMIDGEVTGTTPIKVNLLPHKLTIFG